MEKTRYDPAREHTLARLPVTEHGEEMIAALQRLKSDVDSALSLAVSVLGAYVDQEVHPLEVRKIGPQPTPLTDLSKAREAKQAAQAEKTA